MRFIQIIKAETLGNHSHLQSRFVGEVDGGLARDGDPDVHQVCRHVRERQVADQHLALVSHSDKSGRVWFFVALSSST